MIPLQVDITDAESVKCAFEKVKKVTDELYGIVHLAGIYLLDLLWKSKVTVLQCLSG